MKTKTIDEIDNEETVELIAFMKELLMANELELIEEPIITLKPTSLSFQITNPIIKRRKKRKIGVVSDIEGAIKNAEIAADTLKQENIDALIIAGDVYECFEFRRTPLYPRAKNKVRQMVRGITPFAKLGVPVFVIPGNHEKRILYKEAIIILQKKYSNVIDLENKSFSQNGINIVGLGGYHSKGIMPTRGFFLNNSHYKKAISSLQKMQALREPIIFVTHSPPLTETDLDVVHMIGHLGDPKTTEIMNSDLNNIINVHGHIHEAGGKFLTYPSGIAINAAAITDYSNPRGVNVGLISLTTKRVTYKELR